ncbi:MAG: murein biosynthesis integral membrane protein MurJ [Candidatus Omnitrophota bacterium]
MSIDKSIQAHTSRSIVRSAGVIGFATLCSRILGFIRDIIIARLFGVYVYAQAFVIAFKIPNLLRDFVGEGAANAAFVPVFSEYAVKHSREEFWELAQVVLNILLVLLVSITFLGIVFSPFIVRLIAPGFIASPDKLEAAITLNRLIFPYIILISLTAFSMGILNALKHFTVPAFAPCLLNISIIVCALIWGEGVTGLAVGVLLGGVLQLAVQLPVLYKKGFRFRLSGRFNHPAAHSMLKLMLPRVASSSIYQLNNFADSIFASLAWVVGEGGVAIMYFAYRLILFPLGIFSNALSQAVLPTFSRQALEDNRENMIRTLSFGLRATFFVMVPAAIGFMVLSRPIVSALFEGGRFDSYSARSTSQVLFFYSIGLCAYGGVKILSSCFFALKDTVTPAKVSLVSLILNITLNAILMFPLKLSGLALATSISGIITFFVLLFRLRKKLGVFPLGPVAVSFRRVLIAGIGMGLACYFAAQIKISLPGHTLEKAVNLLLPISAAVVSYIVLCLLLRVEQFGELHTWWRERNNK